MRIARQAAGPLARGREFLAVMREIGLGQPPFQESPRVDARRAVRLEEHQVATLLRIAGPEKMVEADLEQVGRAGVAGDVATEFAIGHVRSRHHRQCIPAHQGGQLFLDCQVARERRLLVHRDGVDVRRDQFGRPGDVRTAGQVGQLVQHEAGAHRPVRGDECEKRIAPFRRLHRIGIGAVVSEEARDAVVGHFGTPILHCTEKAAEQDSAICSPMGE